MTTAPDILARTAVVIPSYNAAKFLPDVIRDVSKQLPLDRIVIVDDGSSDGTAAVASDSGAVVVEHDSNKGKGGAIVTGAMKALEMGMEYFITLDADGQHNPREIPGFIGCTARTGAVMVIGNRMSDIKAMPAIRILANRTTSFFVSLRARQKIPDSQNGYRMHRADLFEKFKLETTRYDAESEILIKASRFGKIESIPVETIYGEEVSAVNPFIDTLRFFRMVFRSLFW